MINKAVWEKQLDDIFRKQPKSEMEIIIECVPLVLYHLVDESQIELFKCLGLDDYIKFNKFFDGKTVKTVRESDLKSTMNFIIIYYYRSVKGLSWEEIKEKVPFEVNAISYSLRIKKFNKNLKKQLDDMLSKIGDK